MRIVGLWSSSSRRLTLLFLAVLVPPAVTLVWLGVQLLEQDRNLWKQRDLERRQTSADAVVRSLAQMLSEAERWGGHSIPEGALRVVISSGETHTEPPGRALWLSAPPPTTEADARDFADGEKFEFRGAAERALRSYDDLARSPQQAVRAGALLRIARVYRSRGRTGEALQAYRDLAAMSGVAIDNVPADLQARRAICDIFDESGRKADLLREAESLQADFLAGRWMLTRADWEFTAGQISRWTGHALVVPIERKALSEAADWLREESGHLDPSGRRVVSADEPVTVLWRADGAKIAALAVVPSVVRAWLRRVGAGASGPVSLTTDSGLVLTDGPPVSGSEAVRRTTAETGLPWNVIVGPSDPSLQSQDLSTRRRLLSLGLGAIVLLLAGGSYLLWRVVQRELAVARLQADFVSAVSHEFRTPLTSLRHITELLEENDDLPRERRQRFYVALGRSTERLHRLVESLLDFGRMELGRKPYELRSADAGAIVAQVVSDFQNEPAAQGFTIHLRLDEQAPPLLADAAALTHALWNLLDNAIKYSEEGREVWVSVGGSEGGVTIAVRDHGIGIPPGERKEIFRKFIRGERAKQLGIKGTGLGLAIVSHIVRAHGGAIELDSEEGKGSTFRLVLPARG
jgi:signal transduction histidine kinase